MGIGRERSERIGFASDRVESLWMCAGIGAGQWFTFDPMNQHELASRLFEMASLSDDERERLGHASRRIAASLGPNRFGEGLKRAATMAIDLPPRKFRAFDRAILIGATRFRR